MLGHKQKLIIELGRKTRVINIRDVRRLYPLREHAIQTMKVLEGLGYFKETRGANNIPEWEYIKEK